MRKQIMSKYNYNFEIEPFENGFTKGNYGSVYEGDDYGSWRDKQNVPKRYRHAPTACSAYEAGLVCGFFSSYGNSEIPEEWREYVISIRTDPNILGIASEAGIFI